MGLGLQRPRRWKGSLACSACGLIFPQVAEQGTSTRGTHNTLLYVYYFNAVNPSSGSRLIQCTHLIGDVQHCSWIVCLCFCLTGGMSCEYFLSMVWTMINIRGLREDAKRSLRIEGVQAIMMRKWLAGVCEDKYTVPEPSIQVRWRAISHPPFTWLFINYFRIELFSPFGWGSGCVF